MAELTDLIIRDCCECDRPEKYDVDTVELRVSDLRLIIDRHLAGLLPGPYYMDPPDGGDISISEQLVRMAADAGAILALSATGAEDAELRKKAARYDWLRNDATHREQDSWLMRLPENADDFADKKIAARTQSNGAAGGGETER